MMPGLYTYAVMSNLPKTLRSISAESLILEAMKSKGRVFAVNLDAELHLSCALPKPSKEDALKKYGKALGASEVPVMNREDFKEYLKEASRLKNPELTKDRSLLVFLDKTPEKAALPAIDTLLFIVSPDHSSIPFIYSILKFQNDSGYHVPVKIAVAGESNIERAAEFFIGIQKELEGLRGSGPEFAFAGNLFFDQDQFELAIGSNLPFIEAFSGGTSHGQIRYIVNRLLVRDLSRTDLTESGYLHLLGML